MKAFFTPVIFIKILTLCSEAGALAFTTADTADIPWASDSPTDHHHDTTASPLPLQRRDDPISGIRVNAATCTELMYTLAREAVTGTAAFALAGHGALQSHLVDLPGNPASYFFSRTQYPLASSIYALATEYITGGLAVPALTLTCLDRVNLCDAPAPLPPAAYLHRAANEIILCPRFLLLPTRPPPCAAPLSTDGLTGLGGTTRELILLEQLIFALSPLLRPIVDGTRASHALLVNPSALPIPVSARYPASPIVNAASYARLAAWAWDVNLVRTIVYPPDSVPAGTCLDLFQPEANPAIGEFPSDRRWLAGYRRFTAFFGWDDSASAAPSGNSAGR